LNLGFFPRRVDRPEILDGPDPPRQEVERSLRDLRRINFCLGGIRAYRSLIRRRAPGTRSVLDVGTGTSDLVASVRDAQLAVGLDSRIDHLLYGRRYGDRVRRVVGDGFRLPFRDSTVDVVTSGHLVHHFNPRENVAMLRECRRVARKAVIVNDTRRSVFPWLFIKVVGLLRLVGRITAHDGPVSVARGYTVDEMRTIAATTRAHRWKVERIFPFRVGLTLWK
jgi:ubiquinone/menaquinone biosynthesis C-methylase UbiE